MLHFGPMTHCSCNLIRVRDTTTGCSLAPAAGNWVPVCGGWLCLDTERRKKAGRSNHTSITSLHLSETLFSPASYPIPTSGVFNLTHGAKCQAPSGVGMCVSFCGVWDLWIENPHLCWGQGTFSRSHVTGESVEAAHYIAWRS